MYPTLLTNATRVFAFELQGKALSATVSKQDVDERDNNMWFSLVWSYYYR